MKLFHRGQIVCTLSVPGQCWIVLAAGVFAAAFLLVDAEPGASAGENDAVSIAPNEQNEQARPRRHRHRKPSDEQPQTAGEEVGDEDPPTPGRNVEYETVKLADGSEVKVEKWGETYSDYDYRPPLNLADQGSRGRKHIPKTEAEVVLDYADRRSGLLQFRGRNLLSVCLDVEHNHLYWIDVYSFLAMRLASIHRANLDGGNIQTLVNELYDPRQLALDLKNHMMYWIESGVEPRGIHRARLDGSKKEHFLHVDANTCAVDGSKGALYYATNHLDHHGRIFTIGVDGAGEALLFERTRSAWSLILSPDGPKLFWTSGYDILRADLKSRESGVAFRTGQVRSFAIDPLDNKIYWINRGMRPSLRRANLDGTQQELLATGLSLPGGLALDTKHRYVYWTETREVFPGAAICGRIRRTQMPPLLTPISRPAPSLITAIQPARGTVGTQVTLTGKGFTGASEVTFVGVGTGEHKNAKFRVASDESIEVTVPALPAECSQAAIVVLTRGGVTVTLPRNLKVVRPKPGGAHTDFDQWAKGQNFSLFVVAGGFVTPLERAIAYVSGGGRISPGNEGKDVFFLKNGAKTSSRWGMHSSIVFHEPFAIINGRDDFAADAKLVAVPAIRPSFVDALFECPKKNN